MLLVVFFIVHGKSKRLSPSVTNESLDSLYSSLIDLGVTGGKLLGAGGGGFFLVHGHDSIASKLIQSLPRTNKVLPPGN